MNIHRAAFAAAAAWAAAATVLTATPAAHAATVFDQPFSGGLGDFTVSGSTSNGSSGVVLRGGSTPGRLNSRVISTVNFSNLKLTVARATSGLDTGERLTLTAVVNGQTRTLEALQSASGSASFNLGNGVTSVSLQFALNASSLLETGTISRVTLEGDAACTGGDCTPTPTAGATIVPDASWACGFPNGIPDPSGGTLVFNTTLSAGTPINIANTPYGPRRVTPTSGGTLSGGSLSGSVLGNALDFELRLPSGAIEYESRYVLRTTSGSLVYMRNCGVADGSDVRFVADFEAPGSSSVQWLNTGTYIGTRKLTAQGIQLAVYSVSPVPKPGAPVVRVPADPQFKQQAFNCTGAPAGTGQGTQVMTANVSIGSSQSVGASKYGRRNIIPITGGSFSGNWSGSVNAGGGDYQLTPVGSSLQIEARYTLRASNGEYIVVRNCGDFAQSDLTQVFFEASSTGAYNALNTGSWVGTITPGLGRVTIRVFERR
jgi:hypothetical protein